MPNIKATLVKYLLSGGSVGVIVFTAHSPDVTMYNAGLMSIHLLKY